MGKPLVNMVNQRFGRLTVIKYTGKNINGNAVWLCKCDCGNIVEVARNNLINRNTSSCGCYKKEVTGKLSRTHGLSNHKHLKWIHQCMKQRCCNPNNKSYKNYGARGIKVCDEWLDKKDGFKNFYNWAISNGYDENNIHNRIISLDRKNNNGDYEPSNCRWTDRITQANNTRSNEYYTYMNKTQTLAQWSREFHINYSTIRARIKSYGWSIERALETPVNNK